MLRHPTLRSTGLIVLTCAAFAILLTFPAHALADRRERERASRDFHDYRAGYDRGDRYRDDSRWRLPERERSRDLHIDVRLGDDPFCRPPVVEERHTRVWVEPVYRTVCDRVWVEPVYRTTYDRVWREPVYREEEQRVWVPEKWELREQVYWDCGRRVVRREHVLVQPARWEIRRHRVLVCEGRWETIERRELVCQGHWKTIERQELLSPGRWEYRTEHVAVHEPHGWPGGSFVDIRARITR